MADLPRELGLRLQVQHHERRFPAAVCPPRALYRKHHVQRLGDQNMGLDERNRLDLRELRCVRRNRRQNQLHRHRPHDVELQRRGPDLGRRDDGQHLDGERLGVGEPHSGDPRVGQADLFPIGEQRNQRHVGVRVREHLDVRQRPVQLQGVPLALAVRGGEDATGVAGPDPGPHGAERQGGGRVVLVGRERDGVRDELVVEGLGVCDGRRAGDERVGGCVGAFGGDGGAAGGGGEECEEILMVGGWCAVLVR